MKYLRIHYLIWAVLVLIYLIGDIILFTLMSMLWFIWSFESTTWKEMHEEKCKWKCNWDGVPYSDKTPLDTFKRRYHYLID